MSKNFEKIYDEKSAELKIVVPVDKNIWIKEQEKAFNKLAKKIEIKGYRKGKVPLQVAKKHISQAEIWNEAISKLLDNCAKEAAKHLDKDKDIVLDAPSYTIDKDKISENKLEINFIYPIFPSIKLKEYKNYKIKFDLPIQEEIKESVKKQINSMLSKGTLLLPKEGPDSKVDDGDTIIFDFKGFINDKPFEGGEAEKYELKIGSNSFIQGFESQLIGKPLGWEGEINVTFPKDYFSEEFRNKEAKFKIKIHEIKYNDKQKLTNDFIKNLNINNVNNEKELNDYLEDLTKRELIEKNKMNFMNDFVIKIIEDNEIPTPKSVVLKELQALFKKFEENLKKQGFTKKDYFDTTGYNDEKVRNELKSEAEKAVKKSMIYSLIAKDLNIKPSDEDFNRQYQRIGKLYNIDPQIAYNMIKKEQIESVLINELVIDRLITLLNPNVKLEKEKVTFVPKQPENKNNKKSKEDIKNEINNKDN